MMFRGRARTETAADVDRVVGNVREQDARTIGCTLTDQTLAKTIATRRHVSLGSA